MPLWRAALGIEAFGTPVSDIERRAAARTLKAMLPRYAFTDNYSEVQRWPL